MSETAVYLVPRTTFSTGEFANKVIPLLEQHDIINGFYEEEHNWFAAGDQANLLFENPEEAGSPPFEYLEIHDNDCLRIIPEGIQGAACCSSCGTDLEELLTAALDLTCENEQVEGQESDMAEIVVICSSCGKKDKITGLQYAEKTLFASQYICMMPVSEELNADKLRAIESSLETSFELLYARI